MRALDAAAHALARAALVVAAIAVGVMAAIVVYTVVQRYGFGRTPYWSEEAPRLLLIWSAFLGAIAAAARGGHLSAGLLPLLVPEGPVRTAIARLRHLLGLVVCVVLAKAGFELAQLVAPQLTAAMQISAAWAYAAGAFGFAGLAVVLLAKALAADPDA